MSVFERDYNYDWGRIYPHKLAGIGIVFFDTNNNTRLKMPVLSG